VFSLVHYKVDRGGKTPLKKGDIVTEIIAIVVGAVTALGAAGVGVYKCYTNEAGRQEVTQQVINNSGSESPNIERAIKDIVAEHMQQRGSESDTEIDIHINIHSSNHEDKTNDKSHMIDSLFRERTFTIESLNIENEKNDY
jgi:hypothetical protein